MNKNLFISGLILFLQSFSYAQINTSITQIDTTLYTYLKVKPSQCNTAITQWDTIHAVIYDNRIDNNKILLWLAGTNGTPNNLPADLLNTALEQGYRIIALSYITVPAVSQICIGSNLQSDVDCAEHFRRKRVYGDNDFGLIGDAQQDAIIPRLVALLIWLDTHDAKANWSQYLNKNKGELVWTKIAVSGQSQGGGMAEYLGQNENLARVISFSGGWDYSNSKDKRIASWYSKKNITPMEKWYTTYNKNELAASTIEKINLALNIPFQNNFALDQDLANPEKLTSSNNPYHGDGIRNIKYKSIWKILFGSGLE